MSGFEGQAPRAAAVIPAHNEARTVRGVVERTLSLVAEVIVVDDGSDDGTAEALEGMPVTLLRLESNGGKGGALAAGAEAAFAAGAEVIVTLDADGQHDPADIPALLALAAPRALVIGDRSGDHANMPVVRRLSNRFGDFFVTWACGQPVRDAQCGLRVYPRALWRDCAPAARKAEGFAFETAMLLHAAEAGGEFRWLPIEARYTGHVLRPSHFRPVMDFLAIAGVIAGFLLRRGLRPSGLLTALGLAR